jgi:hypothetical protein
MARMRFPIDRETEYKGTITFRTISDPEIDGKAMNAAFSSAQNRVKALANVEETAKNGDTPEIREKARAALEQAKAQDTAQMKGLGDFNQSIKRPAKTGNSSTWVQLYLPQAIQFRDGASYDNADLGGAGAVAESALQNGSGLAAAAMKGLANEGSSIIDAMKNGVNAQTGSLAAVRASKYFGDTAQNVVKSALRVTTNPNTRALFKSIPMREFTFQFKLIPQSIEESREIENIIKWFRTELYPEDIPLTSGGPSIGYKFPNKFDITMAYGGRAIPGTKLLPSYLRDVSITYNSNGMQFYRGGGWTSVDLSLSFMETRPLKKSEVKTGVY